MNRVPALFAAPARTAEADLAIDSRSWQTLPDSPGATESRSGSSPEDSAAASGAWHASRRSAILSVIDTFTEAWERGEAPSVEAYLHHLDPADSLGAVELIYREYCLAEADGQGPEAPAYLARFPRHREALERLLRLHDECPTSMLGRWFPPSAGEADLPEAGDSIGPYLLKRELGRGSFARVFLAEEADLENRLIVVKVSTRVTREPLLLARARHAHIVEIVRHTLVDDGAFQLICMPFFGGATLGAVLGARRERPRPPASGRDLLEDLDRVNAPEYPGAHNQRPARELLARLSYEQAIAWIVARLAEALDHAFGREIAHGDVKPSNILLSADGNPMLLDFNLARDGALELDDPGRAADPGGTLAYMAPERLHALANSDPFHDDVRGAEADREPDFSPGGRGPHLADLYGLGTVLLEALTGRPPLAVKIPNGRDAAARGVLMRSAARAYAAARDRGAPSIVRDSEIASGRPIAPGLKAILARCLDPDPSRRYGRSLELAEDLDRWRTDRTLAFTDEPFWGLVVPRWLRRNRRTLIASAASLIVIAMTLAALILQASNLTLDRISDANALGKLARIWDDPESGALTSQLPNNRRLLEPNDRPAIELARRVLRDYDILGPGDVPATGDWRRRDDIRRLPRADRDDLEVWIMERAYRYCWSLENRPDSPADWARGVKILDRVGGPMRILAFEPMRDRLRARLGAGHSAAPSRPAAVASTPPWLDEHLLGFAAECEPESADPRPSDGPVDAMPNPQDRSPMRRGDAERALRHYVDSLALRPDSYWGHYRAAAICYGMGRIAEAAGHLERCLDHRPENSTLRGQLAGCLIHLGRYSEALPLCDQVLEKAPDHAEFYQTRAFLRAKLGQIGGLSDDIRSFEIRRDVLPRSVRDGRGGGGPAPLDVLDVEPRSARRRAVDLAGELDLEEINKRAALARAIDDAGAPELYRIETDKILLLDPDHISARTMRVEQAIATGQVDAARRDLDIVLNHPRLMEYLQGSKDSLRPFHNITRLYLRAGRIDEARRVARAARDFAYRLNRDIGWSQFHLARVYAANARTDPRYINDAAESLYRAFHANPDFKQWYQGLESFDPVRPQIDAALQQIEKSAKARRQMASAVSKGK